MKLIIPESTFSINKLNSYSKTILNNSINGLRANHHLNHNQAWLSKCQDIHFCLSYTIQACVQILTANNQQVAYDLLTREDLLIVHKN
jgi:hypothetical protein